MMWRQIAMVSMLSGCVFGSRKARYIESGVTMAAGVAVGSAPLWATCDEHKEGCGITFTLELMTGGAILLAGALGLLFAALDEPSPTLAEVQASQFLDYASTAARYGDCATAVANARRAAIVDAPSYDHRVAGDANLAGCLRNAR